MTNNWHKEKNSMIEDWHINSSRKYDKKLKAILTKKKQNSSIEIMQYKEDNKKDYSHIVQKMIEVEKEGNSIETKQKELDIIDEEKEKGMIQKDIVKEMLERIERQQDNSTLTNSKDRTLRKELDIGKKRDIMKKEREI